MVFSSEKEVNSLIKHDLGNILQLSEAVLSTEGFKDEYVEEETYQNSMERFSGVLDAAVDRLGVSYNIGMAEQDISYLAEFDPDNFHQDFREKVEKAKSLAEIAEIYSEETREEHDGWIELNDIFNSYNGEYNIENYEGVKLRGDKSLNCVLSTLEDNSYRHGGEDVTPRIEAHRKERKKGEYVLDHWVDALNEEYVDHWSQEVAEDDYKLLFWDDGEGLDEEYHDNPDKIFEKEEGENSGMGLHLSKKIIESFDGEIKVVETHPNIPDDAGMKIEITLPGTTRSRRYISS